MSTILKALKKVEGKRDAVAAKTEIPRALKSPVSEDSRSWVKGIVAIALFLMVAVGVAVGYHFWSSGKKIQTTQKPNDGIITTEIQAKKSAMLNSVEEQKSTPAESTIKPSAAVDKLSPKESGIPKKQTSLNRFTETTSQSPPVVVDLPTEKPVDQQRSRSPEINQPSRKQIDKHQNRTTPEPQMMSKTSVQPKPSSSTISPTENRPKVEVPLLENRSLEIQALVYSEDSAKRMIVLNGEILRQGDEYKGYTLEAIESQRVLVKKNGKVSALLFGK